MAINNPGSTSSGSNIPTGTIVIWSGAEVDIPSGWAICNGNNSTPDLRDKFVLGAGNSYAVNATGGTNTHSHGLTGVSTVTTVDSFTSVTTSSNTTTITLDSNTDTITNAETDGHEHTLLDLITEFAGGREASYYYAFDGEPGTTTDNMTDFLNATTDGHDHNLNDLGHSHSITSNTDGHEHAVTGSLDDTNTLPNYFALAYIMKT